MKSFSYYRSVQSSAKQFNIYLQRENPEATVYTSNNEIINCKKSYSVRDKIACHWYFYLL